MSDNPIIFFHVGLGKTGSTYLQNKFFPKLKGIQYIPSRRYRQSKKIIAASNSDRILVSREFDRQLQDEVTWFTKSYPKVQILIVLRRHDQWILSQYKRHIKNGFQGSLKAFIEIENDNGFWEKRHLTYLPMLEWIAQKTGRQPKVIIYEDFYKTPKLILKNLAKWMQADWFESNFTDQRVHSSYSTHQLIILRQFTRNFCSQMPERYPNNKWKHWLLYRPYWGVFHLVLYTAQLMPKKLTASEAFYDPDYLSAIKKHFEDDWKAVLDYPSRLRISQS